MKYGFVLNSWEKITIQKNGLFYRQDVILKTTFDSIIAEIGLVTPIKGEITTEEFENPDGKLTLTTYETVAFCSYKYKDKEWEFCKRPIKDLFGEIPPTIYFKIK